MVNQMFPINEILTLILHEFLSYVLQLQNTLSTYFYQDPNL